MFASGTRRTANSPVKTVDRNDAKVMTQPICDAAIQQRSASCWHVLACPWLGHVRYFQHDAGSRMIGCRRSVRHHLRVVPVDGSSTGEFAVRPRAGREMAAACTNPAALAGGSGALHAYMDSTGVRSPPHAGEMGHARAEDRDAFVSVPGLLTAECASNENATGFLSDGARRSERSTRRRHRRHIGVARRSSQLGLHLIDGIS